MVDNMVVPVTANLPASVTPSGGVAGGAGQDSSQAANFTDILQTVISNLDRGMGNIQGDTIVNADGKTISLDDLIQQLLNGGSDNKTDSGKKTDSGNGINDLLQQMVTQLQGSIAQPAVVVPSGQTNSSGVELAALSDNLTNNTAGPDLNAINAAMMSVGAALAGIAQQNPANNGASQTSDNMNNVEDAASTGIGQQNIIDNAASPALNGMGAATLNSENPTLNDMYAAMQNAMNAATTKTGNTTTNALNPTTLNSALTTQNDINVITLNPERPMPNAASAAPLTAGTSGQNSGSPDQSGMSAPWLLDSNMSVASSIQNASDVEGTGLSPAVQKNSNNSENSADTSAMCAAVPLYKTFSAEDAKPTQETLPVSRLSELSEPILKTLGSGDSNLVIKLSPPDMGTIQIKLKMENGVLTADFKVDSSAVKDLFTSAMPQIKQSIESSGIKTGNFFTDLKEDSYRDGRRQQDQNQQQQQKQSKEQKSGFFDFFA